MLKGVNLQLYVGPLVPIPAPKSVMDALTDVTVTINDVGPERVSAHISR